MQINTPKIGVSYLQLNKQQTQELVVTLRNWLAENELPAPVGDGIMERVADLECHPFTNDY